MAMRLAVLGATGETGQEVVRLALDAGHKVIALVRNPDKLKVKHDNLKVQTCNIFSKDSMVPHFSGCDAVLSCLGAPVTYFKPVTLMHDSCKVIVEALRKAEVKKLILMSSQYLAGDTHTPFTVKLALKPWFIHRIMVDLEHMEAFVVKECQDLDFIVVKPPTLTNKPLESGTLVADEGQSGSGRHNISRANVAQFMLEQAANDQWNKKLVSVSMQN